jgi:hypothetical protein
MAAASASFAEASNSPAAWIIFARFSRSASAYLDTEESKVTELSKN